MHTPFGRWEERLGILSLVLVCVAVLNASRAVMSDKDHEATMAEEMNSQSSAVAESQDTVVMEDVSTDEDQKEGGANPAGDPDEDQGEGRGPPDEDQSGGGECPDRDQSGGGTCPDGDQKEEGASLSVVMSISEEVESECDVKDQQTTEDVAGGGTASATEADMLSQSSQSEEDSPKPKPTFHSYKTLEEFGYHFNEDDQLRSIDGDKPFVFEVKKGDSKFNQAHYEALGEVITEEVYQLLETRTKLKREYIPKKPKKGEPQSFIFLSEDALTNRDKLMVLIHGSGVVRAGQWARSLIINDCLKSGTQLPYIERAQREGYGVIVLNTNYNRVEPEGPLIRDNGSPSEHAQYVWKHFVKGAKARRIYIVAHSFGGVVTVDMVASKFDEMKKRVHKIAFTDSVHMLHGRLSPKARKWMIERSVNWVTSGQRINKLLESQPTDIKRRSAGTEKHVETSWYSFEHVFKYFSD